MRTLQGGPLVFRLPSILPTWELFLFFLLSGANWWSLKHMRGSRLLGGLVPNASHLAVPKLQKISYLTHLCVACEGGLSL